MNSFREAHGRFGSFAGAKRPRLVENKKSYRKRKKTRVGNGLRPFLMGDFLLRSQKELFLLSKLVNSPLREEIEPALLGMSSTTRGEVPRPFSRFSIVTVARISASPIFQFLARKKKLNRAPILIKCQFSAYND